MWKFIDRHVEYMKIALGWELRWHTVAGLLCI